MSSFPNFLLFGFQTSFHFLYILGRWECFGANSSVNEHTSHRRVIFDVFTFYPRLPSQILLLNIYRSHFSGKVFSLNCYG